MNIDIKKAVLAGMVGTVAITVVATFGAPMMGLPKMDIAGMLAGQMGGNLILGWMAHFMIGTILAFGYAFFHAKLCGPAVVRGALYGIAPWLMAQVVVMPMMGMGFFSGAVATAMGSLIGHLVYGAVVGLVYSSSKSCHACAS